METVTPVSTAEECAVIVDFGLALLRGDQVIADRNLNDTQITLNPSDMASTNKGQLVEVTATAPFDSNRIFPSFFFGGQTLTADVTMQRE